MKQSQEVKDGLKHKLDTVFDVIVIGGGATGLGCALEASSRGYKTLLLEAEDYGKGTSSKSTKLVHGGLRYLENFDFELVREGLKERFYFLKNAPHLAQKQSYLIPSESLWNTLMYTVGVKLYGFLSGKLKLGKDKYLSQKKVLAETNNGFERKKVVSAVQYFDGQFDDTRLLISLMRTVESLGGVSLNHHKVQGFLYKDEKICGVSVLDTIQNQTKKFYAQIVINATGTFTDSLMNKADKTDSYNLVATAQGTHIVVDKAFFDSKHAILIPKTTDGRVLFILPWYNKIIIGTTDIKVPKPTIEPSAQKEEIDFIIDTFNAYAQKKITKKNIKSVFCGQRPLVKPARATKTATISRKHEIFTSKSGLVSIVGGKWTIYRKMGEDTLNFIEKSFELAPTKSTTKNLPLIDYKSEAVSYPLSVYGTEATEIQKIQKTQKHKRLLHQALPYFEAEIIHHIRKEHAKTIEDVLLRRTRAAFLDANASVEAAPKVAQIMARELGQSKQWQEEQIASYKSLISKNFKC